MNMQIVARGLLIYRISDSGAVPGFSSPGTFFAGILAESTGIQWAIGGFALMLVVVSIALTVFSPRLRRLD